MEDDTEVPYVVAPLVVRHEATLTKGNLVRKAVDATYLHLRAGNWY